VCFKHRTRHRGLPRPAQGPGHATKWYALAAHEALGEALQKSLGLAAQFPSRRSRRRHSEQQDVAIARCGARTACSASGQETGAHGWESCDRRMEVFLSGARCRGAPRRERRPPSAGLCRLILPRRAERQDPIAALMRKNPYDAMRAMQGDLGGQSLAKTAATNNRGDC